MRERRAEGKRGGREEEWKKRARGRERGEEGGGKEEGSNRVRVRKRRREGGRRGRRREQDGARDDQQRGGGGREEKGRCNERSTGGEVMYQTRVEGSFLDTCTYSHH